MKFDYQDSQRMMFTKAKHLLWRIFKKSKLQKSAHLVALLVYFNLIMLKFIQA